MYICEKCGKLVEDEDLPKKVETLEICEDLSFETKQVFEDQCSCGGYFFKAVKCEMCDEYFVDDSFSICESCRDSYRNLDTVLEIGTDWEDKLSINGFLASVFKKEDIELILLDALKNMEKDKIEKAIKNYCEDDLYYFWRHAESKWKEGK